jgi:outer membrane lipopolysaccharide assembly protein LptE/RlpB
LNYRLLILYLCLGLCFLSGCGFRLNTAAAFSEDLSSTQIQLQNVSTYSHFYRAFYTLSKASGLTILDRHIERAALPPDTLVLWLSEPQFNERPLSYSSDGQTNYVMIELRLSCEIRDTANHLLSANPIILARPMSVSPNALLNNDSQRAMVRDALTQKACMQVLQRLNAQIKPS